MGISASALRQNIYRLLDQVIETGEDLVIERNGVRLRIVVDGQRRRLERLVARPDVIVGDPEDFVHLDWSDEWRP